MENPTTIPVTVVSGALGSGKTTVILNLIKQLPDNYQSVWLKNEYGDVNIDSELVKESNIQTKEILNGCICCVLIGKLHLALEEIMAAMKPDRIIIETAGTAYPFPIVNEMSRVDGVKLDGLITVVDALNFDQFRDKSQLAKQQAKYVDLVIINKTGLVDNTQLETIKDDVYEMYLDCPKVETADGFVSKDLMLGIDHVNFVAAPDLDAHEHGHEHEHQQGHEHEEQHQHSHGKEEAYETFGYTQADKAHSTEQITQVLNGLRTGDYYRIKGIVRTPQGFSLLNYVFGRIDWQALPNYSGPTKINFIGRDIKSSASQVLTKISECIVK